MDTPQTCDWRYRGARGISKPFANPAQAGILVRREMDEVLRLQVKGGVEAPATARAALASVPDLAGVEGSVALLVSELVTNSVKHAAADLIELNLFSSPTNVRVEVVDRGTGFDPFATPEPAFGGFGLYLVDKLADRWGVETKEATTIWFEMGRA
jgi:anti-sigma regulatory factor (Ser/Thr protein kinase)